MNDMKDKLTTYLLDRLYELEGKEHFIVALLQDYAKNPKDFKEMQEILERWNET